MNCLRCDSDRIAMIVAKCGDRCHTQVYGHIEYNREVFSDMAIGGGDYIQFRYCLDCGQMQDEFPLPETEAEYELGTGDFW